MITSVLSLVTVYYISLHVQDTIANLNAKCRLSYYFSGKPSYSVTKSMKFITTFDKKNVARVNYRFSQCMYFRTAVQNEQ